MVFGNVAKLNVIIGHVITNVGVAIIPNLEKVCS